MGIELPGWVENIVGKGEIARYKQFLLFAQCIQKLSVVGASKWVLKAFADDKINVTEKMKFV